MFEQYRAQLAAANIDERLEAIKALVALKLTPAQRDLLTANLIALLQDSELRIRAAAAEALGELNAPEAAAPLNTLLDDPSPEVRDAALKALTRLTVGAPQALPPQQAIPAVELPITPTAPPSAPPAAPNAVPSRSREEAADEESEAASVETVQFSAYYPREVVPNQWQPLIAYIYKASAAIEVVEDAQQTLGGLMATVRRIVEAARQTIPVGTMITATPYLPGFQFNPPSLTIGFFEDWHRLDFKLRSVDAAINQASNGRLTFTVEGIIVSDVPLSIYVGETGGGADSGANSGKMMTMTQKLYKSIFCSYSHDDAKIVERVERAYKILGFDFLRDVNVLKSGQDWNDGLYQLIEQADIFQLFWSSTAADSKYVEREWQYAHSLDRDETNFIRPVYWQEPMPTVPELLSSIHFAYEPTLDDV